jgi:orotate phosphoribosyltransferase
LTAPTARVRLLDALRTYSLRTGDFTLASGRRSSWYLDARQVTFRGDCVEMVGRSVLEALETLDGTVDFDAVGGLTLGADPVALAVALVSGRRAFSVRKEDKDHGSGGRMAGAIQPGDRVLVVDDAVTTGGSTLAAVGAIRDYGAGIVAAACLLDRGGELGPRLAELDIPFFPVLGAPDLGFAFGS